MKKVSLNEFKDCIVDEKNNIVAEKPRWFDRHNWEQGELLVNAFNKKLNLADVGSSFFISDLEKKLEIAKHEMGTLKNPTWQLRAAGKMLAYKDILDGIKNGYYK